MVTSSLRTLASRTLIQGALIATALSTTGCKDDPGPGKLFDEDGAWELSTFALEGSGTEAITMSRRGDFLMKFDEENGVVQTAMCSNDDVDDPTNSECEGFTDSMWICQCFAYDFVEDQMAWLAFEAGSTPPMVKVGEIETPDAGDAEAGSGGDTDTDGAGSDGGEADAGGEEAPPSGIHQFSVAEVAGSAATFDFTPLPAGVFGSDGLVSKYTFVKKAPSAFDRALEDTERPTCTPCI